MKEGGERLKGHIFCIDIRNIEILLLMSLLSTDPVDIFGSAKLDLKLARGIEFSVTVLPMKNIFNPNNRF